MFAITQWSIVDRENMNISYFVWVFSEHDSTLTSTVIQPDLQCHQMIVHPKKSCSIQTCMNFFILEDILKNSVGNNTMEDNRVPKL